jgi:ribosomal-protein-alanine N-acetyltransferase
VRLLPVGADGTAGDGPGKLPAEAIDVCASIAAMYEKTGYVPPWIAYLAWDGDTCVGTCAFKSPPQRGRVEIAYFTFPPFEGRGIATDMARSLLRVADRTDRSLLVIAHTLPKASASTAILTKLGFALQGTIDHPEDGPVWEWHRMT